MTKDDLASLLIGARVMSLAEFRALLARLGFIHFRPAPFDVEQMNEVADALLVAEKEVEIHPPAPPSRGDNVERTKY